MIEQVIAVVGPTATGKSDLGIAVAKAVGGEVVNADSMQLYRGMDIGTAKVPPAKRQGVAHHLLDIWDVTETASVADYQRRARGCVEEILARAEVPVVVGGSGLYVHALLDDFTFPGTDPPTRTRLEAELAAVGAPVLHHRLATLDPAAAAAILPTNGRRIVRALEVIELTGRPFRASLAAGKPVYPSLRLGLDRPAPDLDDAIDRRVAAMFAGGLLDEVRALVDLGLREGRTARRALGYQQALAALDGRLTESEAITETARATRRFARRQRSWFRRDRAIRWLPTNGTDPFGWAISVINGTAG